MTDYGHDKLLEQLPLSTRLKQALHNTSLRTVGDARVKTPEELLAIHGIGDYYVTELVYVTTGKELPCGPAAQQHLRKFKRVLRAES